jgi:hypothetical protein
LKKILSFTILSFLLLFSCKKDEEEVEPLRDVSEQSIADDQLLEDFLSTHFYNYEDFEDQTLNPKIIFDTISGDNSSKTSLLSQVTKKTVRVKTSAGDLIDHNLYYLVAREGIGKSPSSVDSTYQAYEGLLLDGTVFDGNANPVWFDLTSLVRGFREGIPSLKAGDFRR